MVSVGETDVGAIVSRKIAVIGYGNQGRAHALNLRDSGCEVRVGTREGSANRAVAEADGFSVGAVELVAGWADLISFLVPDQVQGPVYRNSIRERLTAGKMLMVAHGFSIHYGLITPPDGADVAMVAPVGPGSMLRRMYLEGSGIPAVVAVQQDATGTAHATAMAYSAALGCTRAGVRHSTFAEETETDLFGEQAVLCGGLPALIVAGFETLVEAGYQPELAYYECVHQVKLIVDLIYEGGISGMRAAISDTARFGSYIAGPRLVDGHVREAMRALLGDIQGGGFARAWMSEADAGAPNLRLLQREEAGNVVEQLGRKLRSEMGLS